MVRGRLQIAFRRLLNHSDFITVCKPLRSDHCILLPWRKDSGPTPRRERPRQTRKDIQQLRTFSFEKFGQHEYADDADADTDFYKGRDVDPEVIEGFVGIPSYRTEQVDHHQDGSDPCPKEKSFNQFLRDARICGTYSRPIANRSTILIFCPVEIRNLQMALAGSIRMTVSESILNKQIVKTSIPLSIQ